MDILGIETSCDETSASVVRDGRKILSNVVFSQEKEHRPFRGIVPEIASRAHVEKINAIVDRALNASGRAKGSGIDAIAVTVGPGLVGSLLVGKMTAEALGWVWNVPVIGVNHLEAHAFSALLNHPQLTPPFLGLVVSGGHTDLIHIRDFGDYSTLGRTRDDSAGESFDKVANLLGLGYPGGPAIDRLAKTGNANAVPFPRPYLKESWDFSFSGLKTSVLYFLKERNPAAKTRAFTADVCASFQSAVVDVLVWKAVAAVKRFRIPKVALGGGVSANSELRARFVKAARENKFEVFFPSVQLSTDNAAMVASAGYFKRGMNPRLSIDPSLPVASWRR